VITRIHRPLALLAVFLTSLSVLLAGGALSPSAAAEAVRTYALTKGHIDLFDVTYDADAEGLRLSVKDDTGLYDPGSTFRDPSDVSIVVDGDLARMDVSGLPEAYDFLKVDGNTIYTLPLSQDQDLPWPGWSTERLVGSLPDGVSLPSSNDAVKLEVDVEGPGEVFSWQNGAFGNPTNRYVDTVDPAADVIPVSKGAHVHTAWAFTRPGDYLLTVSPTATTSGGEALTGAVATYHVHVGDAEAIGAPENADAPTITGEVKVGGTVTATPGAWTPEPEEFRYQWLRGAKPIEGATSATYTPAAEDYARSLSVRVGAVVPGRQTGFATSDADYVADENGDLFAIAGHEDSYEVGDTLDTSVVGHTLAENEMYLWVVRPIGADDGYVTYGSDQEASFQGHLTQVLDAGHDGYELQVYVADETTWRSTGTESPWVALEVTDAADVQPMSTAFPDGTQYLGDDVVLPLSRGLADDETARLVYRGSTSPWFEVQGATQAGDTIVARPPWAIGKAEFAVQVMRDGLAVTQSAPVAGEIADREVLVEGVQGVYRVGQSVTATAEVHPAKDGLTYRWYLLDDDWNEVVLEEGTGASALTLEMPATLELHDELLRFKAIAHAGTPDEVVVGDWSTTLKVSDADPDTQLLFFESLSGHYHQGYTINLDLVADPALADGDTIAWEWKWPGQEWASFPGVSGLSHEMLAEQALAGVQVRATLDYADSEETVVAEPVTIHHDDHGSPARQQPAVGGETSYVEGDAVTLKRDLPANGPTVLTDHRWERKVGDGEWTVVEGQTSAELSLTAGASDDGASYRVSILKPGGALAYGPSPAITLSVDDAPAVVNAELPVVTGEPTVGETLSASAGAWDPQPDEVSYRWFAGDRPIVGATGDQLALTADLVDQRVRVEVTAGKAGHTAGVAESSPTAAIGAGAPPTGPDPVAVVTSVSATATQQVWGRPASLEVAVSPNATGTVSVRVGTRSVTGTLSAGRATVVLPPKGLEPGKRKLTISYAGSGSFQPATGAATVRVVRAKPRVRVNRATLAVARGTMTTFRITATAAGVRPDGRVTVKVAGQKETVKLRNGKATVKVRIPRSTAPGARVVSVTYAGDRHVAQAKARTKIRVTR
jgi:surface-anchored protein